MGGKKGVGSSVLNVGVKGATFGAVGTDGSGYAQKMANGEGISALDVAYGATGTGGAATSEAMKAMTPGMPKMPAAEDQALQAKRAEAEASAKAIKEVGERGKGLSSTILGGSINTDDTVLKKKKLLGA